MLSGPDQAAAYQGSDACADFEALLLQGRASLDRLTWFLGDVYKNPCKSFRRIRNVLSDFAGKDEDARELLALVNAANSWFDGTFGKLDTPQSLRDLVAHHHALVEGTRTCFSIARVSPDRSLAIDCEVQLPGLSTSLPVLRTAHTSVMYLSYLILNGVSIFLDSTRLPLEKYESTWHLQTVVLSDYAKQEPPGSPLGPNWVSCVSRMTPDGFQVATFNVDPAIFKHAVGG